jgi:hypothetical protein
MASTLSGCARSGTFPASCWTTLDDTRVPGVVRVDYDVPTTVQPGQTFRVTVNFMVGYIEPPDDLEGGTLTMTGPVNGPTTMTAWPWDDPPSWPFHFDFTVTGQPGQTIDFRTSSGVSRIIPAPGAGYVQICQVDALLQRIRIE